ncbi:MAG TPA: shikimate kinase [Gemmatales bacterium]|nr:shikimate kinase [Gemmatales bacterium]HMP57907.1 shikimate kinase [Gemmatales bacterium]
MLIGPRGSGKSTLAPLLAERLGWPWLDLDTEIQQLAGRTIAEIFATQGIEGFRNLEAAQLATLLNRSTSAATPRVLAAGGGIVLQEANRELLRRAALVVYLQADAETLWKRIASDPRSAAERPALTALAGQGEIAQLLAERAPLYEATADLIVNTAAASPAALAHELYERLSTWTCST